MFSLRGLSCSGPLGSRGAEGVAVADWAKGIGLRPDDVADFMFGQALRAAPDADAASPQDVSGGGAFPPARPSLRVVT